ncbi:hypothetical protein [Alcanivorax sp. 1008]|uniref:hypothetical protein n=1 Tax=Alcanivorax sp. 1008 TaxID=2816853 RepID=UPI001E034370|nr:hypothetical protein [Alcanivorax sp. 1008]MCC1496727.1 hypothetical protein [Alcanivorax sp. 1008]
MKKRTVTLRPRVTGTRRATADDIAAAIIAIKDGGWFDGEEARQNIVFDCYNPTHAAALEVLGQFIPRKRAEVLRAAMMFAASGGEARVVTAPVAEIEAETAEKAPEGEVGREEDKKIKVDPSLKSLRGML